MRNKYAFGELVGNVFSLIVTVLFYRPARLVRRPIYIRGRKSMVIGRKMTLGHSCRFDLEGKKKTLFIGDNCEFGDNVHIVALKNVQIGNNVLSASKVFISDTNHGSYKGENQDSPLIPPRRRRLISDDVVIGNNVWIGENVVILAGTTIGDGCVIGANSVVKGKYNRNEMIAGVPAHVIKAYSTKDNQWI